VTPPSPRDALPWLVAGVLLALPCGVRADSTAVTIEQRVEAARACVADLTAAGDWVDDRPYAVDWIDRGRWCLAPTQDGDGAAALPCDGASAARATLRIERDRETGARIDRLALNLDLAPPDSRWRVHLYATTTRLEPGSPLGEASYSLATVSVVPADGEGAAVSLTRFGFEVGDRVVVAPGEYLAPEALRDRLRSPEALRAALVEQVDLHVQRVERLLDERQLSLCPEPDAADRFQCGPMGDGEGHAMYDTCVRRTLTEDETAEARARLHREADARRALVSAEHRSIQSAVTEALAHDACWLGVIAPTGFDDPMIRRP
jgi:hypothetical protein